MFDYILLRQIINRVSFVHVKSVSAVGNSNLPSSNIKPASHHKFVLRDWVPAAVLFQVILNTLDYFLFYLIASKLHVQ